MFDQNLLFSDAQALTADAYSSNALNVAKTGDKGVDIEICFTAFTTVDTIDVRVLALAADSGWNYATEAQKVAQVQFTGTGRKVIHCRTKLAYVKLHYDGATWGGGSATVTAGIVPGGPRDAAA